MTLTTQTAAKEIPPRVRSPAGKSKKKATVEKIKKKRKRDDHDEDSEIYKPKKRKMKTKQCSKSSESDEEESEVEVVEDGEPVPGEIAVVDDGEVSAMGDEEVSKIRMTCITHNTLGRQLNQHQQGEELETKPVKKDLTLNMLTVMSDKVKVQFKVGRNYEEESGRWCNLCK
jgi:hypothetical protein